MADPLDMLDCLEDPGLVEQPEDVDPLDPLSSIGAPVQPRGRPPTSRAEHAPPSVSKSSTMLGTVADHVLHAVLSSMYIYGCEPSQQAPLSMKPASEARTTEEVDADLEIICAVLPGRVANSQAEVVAKTVLANIDGLIKVPKGLPDVLEPKFIAESRLHIAHLWVLHQRAMTDSVLRMQFSSGESIRKSRNLEMQRLWLGLADL